MAEVAIGEVSWERMIRAVERVRERLRRSTAALNSLRVSYAVIGGHAVESWVARVEPSAVRSTPDVEILIRRPDRLAATTALVEAGFVPHRCGNRELFVDGPGGAPRSAVKLTFSGELPRPSSVLPAPDISESVLSGTMWLLGLEPLATMMLSSHSIVDRVLVRDMIDVGLIDATWLNRLPPVLAARLRHLIDTPDG